MCHRYDAVFSIFLIIFLSSIFFRWSLSFMFVFTRWLVFTKPLASSHISYTQHSYTHISVHTHTQINWCTHKYTHAHICKHTHWYDYLAIGIIRRHACINDHAIFATAHTVPICTHDPRRLLAYKHSASLPKYSISYRERGWEQEKEQEQERKWETDGIPCETIETRL